MFVGPVTCPLHMHCCLVVSQNSMLLPHILQLQAIEAIPFPASAFCDTPFWLTVQVALTSSQQAANQVQTLQNDVAASEQRVADTRQRLDDTQVGPPSSH